MFRSVVVPLDGDASSEAAVTVAAMLARTSGARLHLVHVLELDTLAKHAALAPPTMEFSLRAAALAVTYLEEVAARLAGGLRVSCEVLHEPVIDALLRFSTEIGADLIVMARHSKRAEYRRRPGSTAQLLTLTSSCPVLLCDPADQRLPYTTSSDTRQSRDQFVASF
jgi:nucleotide-binding universal stress UspA family protein